MTVITAMKFYKLVAVINSVIKTAMLIFQSNKAPKIVVMLTILLFLKQNM